MEVDRKALAQLAEQAERRESQPTRLGSVLPDGWQKPQTPNGSPKRTLPSRQEIGSEAPEACPGCGFVIEKVCEEILRSTDGSRIVAQWIEKPHRDECEPLKALLDHQAQEEAKKRLLRWLYPDPETVKRVQSAAGLPFWIGGGLGDEGIRLPWALRGEDRGREFPKSLMSRLRGIRDNAINGAEYPDGVWLQGTSGVGKTLLLGALAFDIQLRAPNVGVQYWTLVDYLEQWRAACGRRESRYDPDRIRMARLLVIDDLGSAKATKNSSSAAEQVCLIADAVYNRTDGRTRQVLCVSSNEEPEVLQAHWGRTNEANDEGFGERVVRRLVKTCGTPVLVRTR